MAGEETWEEEREEGKKDQSWSSWLSGLASSAYDYVASATGTGEAEADGGSATGDAEIGEDSDRRALWDMLKDHVGSDVMSLFSIPASMMEPVSTLQKMAEIMEHSYLLDLAASEADATRRVSLVAAFALSVYAASERTFKPFNPLLGETFEASLREDESVRYVAEQVSHHPPVASAKAWGPGWTYEITSAPTTRFLGNSVEVHPLGRTRIHLAGKTYSLAPPTNRVHNVIIGRTWIDAFGQMEVKSLDGLERALVDFYPCGWFGANQHVVNGFAESTTDNHAPSSVDGTEHASETSTPLNRRNDKHYCVLSGKWNEYLTRAHAQNDLSPVEGTEETLWTAGQFEEDDAYGFKKFAVSLNKESTMPAEGVLPSDSRLRPDRAALEHGNISGASRLKHELEEGQRAERRERDSRGETYYPRFFTQVEDCKDSPVIASTQVASATNEEGNASAGYDESAGTLEPTAATERGITPWRMDDEAYQRTKSSEARVSVGSLHTGSFSPWQYPYLHAGFAYGRATTEDER